MTTTTQGREYITGVAEVVGAFNEALRDGFTYLPAEFDFMGEWIPVTLRDVHIASGMATTFVDNRHVFIVPLTIVRIPV